MKHQKLKTTTNSKSVLKKTHKLKIKKTIKPRIIDATMENLGKGFSL